MRLVRVFAGLSLLLALTACLIPEKCIASVSVNPDGSYLYKYDGTAAHVLAAMAIKKQGTLSAKDEAGLKQDAEKGSKEPGVRKLQYLGNGQYDISIERAMKPEQRRPRS